MVSGCLRAESGDLPSGEGVSAQAPPRRWVPTQRRAKEVGLSGGYSPLSDSLTCMPPCVRFGPRTNALWERKLQILRQSSRLM